MFTDNPGMNAAIWVGIALAIVAFIVGIWTWVRYAQIKKREREGYYNKANIAKREAEKKSKKEKK